MIRFARNAAVVATYFLLFDIPWLLAMAGTYRGWIGPLMAEDTSVGYAVVFYLAYSAAAYWLAVRAALERGSLRMAAISGGVLGFAAYGTYGFTNAATLRDWPAQMLFIDTIWGTLLTAASCAAAYATIRRIDRRTGRKARISR